METVNIKIDVFWRFKNFHHLKVTKCKRIINCKTGKFLKQHTRGYFISSKYIKRSDLNSHIEPLPVEDDCPF